MRRALLVVLAVVMLLAVVGCSSSDSTSSDEYAAPDEIAALIDDWYQALERQDDSVLELYVPEGYHLYGDERIEYDEIPGHLQVDGIRHVWITDPLLITEDEDGRYVAVRGMSLTSGIGTHASALMFEIVTTPDDELRFVQTAWFYDSEWSDG